MSRLLASITVAALSGVGLSAQWLHYATSDVPRTPDGRPNLQAPASRTATNAPDLSGMWQHAHPLPCDDVNRVCTDLPISAQFADLGAGLPGGLPYSAWAREELGARAPDSTDPYTRCLTPGGPRMHLLPTMKKIVQTPALILILNEYNTSYRQIHLDGRPLPIDPQPTWQGYSTGRWEDDTLVVRSQGFRDDQWLDAKGSPLTSSATVTERFRRPNFGTLEITITVDDPKAYTRPWTVLVEQVIVPDSDMLDTQCLENEKDLAHLP